MGLEVLSLNHKIAWYPSVALELYPWICLHTQTPSLRCKFILSLSQNSVLATQWWCCTQMLHLL